MNKLSDYGKGYGYECRIIKLDRVRTKRTGRDHVILFALREDADDAYEMKTFLQSIGITANIRFPVIQDPEEFDEE